MPRKTKKQKILAEYRRKLKQLETKASFPKSDITAEIPSQKPVVAAISQPSLKNNQKKKIDSTPPLKYDQSLARYTLADIKKSFLITLVILMVEFSVFYVNLVK